MLSTVGPARRNVATAAAFPASDGAGTRPVVQHRRRVRKSGLGYVPQLEPAKPAAAAAQAAAKTMFALQDQTTKG